MSDTNIIPPAVSGTNRRQLLTRAGLFGAAALGTGLLGSGIDQHAEGALTATYTPGSGAKFTIADADILNFALNLEYLEAEFYLRAATGVGLPDSMVSGVGTLGAVTGGTNAVPFQTSSFQAYAHEIAMDEMAHVTFLRNVLGDKAVARPAINFTSAFTNAAIAAGVIPSGSTFDPFSSEDFFLLGSYIFEDVGVTAYHGAAPYIKNPAYLGAAAGILAVEAYHAGEIRSVLYGLGQTTPAILEYADQISVLRNTASKAYDGVAVTDEGINRAGGVANVVPSDGNALAFARSFGSVLNIVYLNTTATPTPGGFFPSGLNGRIF
jgi:hypothetical protein